MGRVFLALLFLVGCVVALTPIKYPATTRDGVEVINLGHPTALGYAANLAYNNKDSNNITLFFTADKANPNLFTAGLDGSFWSTGRSFFPPLSVSPFVSLDVIADVVIGVSLPSNFTAQESHGTMLQAVFAKGYNDGEYGISAPVVLEGYTFYSLIVDKSSASLKGEANFYVTGYANDNLYNIYGFFVARGRANITGTVPVLFLSYEDISSGIITTNCFDVYNEIRQPKMWVDDNHLYLLLTGRCAAITKTPLGANPFSSTIWQPALYPSLPGKDSYISDGDLDSTTGLLFFSLQDYNRRDMTTVSILNMRTWLLSPTNHSLYTGGSSQALLKHAIEPLSGVHYLYVLASGANTFLAYTVNKDQQLAYTGTARIPDKLDGISSPLYIHPYLFWTTYSRDAAIVRIHRSNFCSVPCPPNAYCDNGVCKCQSDWAEVYNNSHLLCINKMIVETQNKIKENEDVAIALGVCLSFISVIAGAGWFMWLKQRASNTSLS